MSPVGAARVARFSQLDAIPDSGVSRYEFEQDVTDSWGPNDGTDNTSAGYVTGTIGSYAKDFDGADDYVDITYSVWDIGSSDAYTYTAWVKTTSTAKQVVWNHRGSDGSVAQLKFNEDAADANTADTIRLFARDGGGTILDIDFSATVTDGNWHLIGGAVNPSSGGGALYYDGSKSATGTASIGAFTFDNNQHGGDPSGVGQYMDGPIDDPRAYSKELTDTEFNNLYNTDSIA